MWLIAVFGILHGINEWIDMYLLTQSHAISNLMIIRALIMPLSFFFLFQFGVNCISKVRNNTSVLKALPAVFFVFWTLIIAASNDKLLTGDIMGRYLLCFPGSLFSSYALYLQLPAIKEKRMENAIFPLNVSSAALAMYGIFSGLIVPFSDFFPASFINYNLFREHLGFPVQLLRAMCALLITFGLINTLKIYSWERLRFIRRTHEELEDTVARRTEELMRINEELEMEISERRRAEEELKESESRFRGAFENVAVGASMVDLKGKFIKVNRSLCNMLGYLESELLTMTFSDITHPEDVNIGIKEVQKMIAGEYDNSVFEKRYLHKNGHILYMSINPTLIRDRQGKAMYFVSLLQDVTERKLAEEFIRNSLREKEVLLQEVHHRVKNNMQVISSLLRLQSRHITDPNARRLFNDSQSRIRAMSLIHEKLYKSSDIANINFKEYVESLVGSLIQSMNIGLRSVTLKIDVDDIYLNTDTALPCGLIINELISNSLKYAFPENKRGEIRISLHKENEGEFVLTVSDNGIGFPEEIALGNSKTLGLELVNILAEQQLRGASYFNTQDGVAFTVKFRELEYKKRF